MKGVNAAVYYTHALLPHQDIYLQQVTARVYLQQDIFLVITQYWSVFLILVWQQFTDISHHTVLPTLQQFLFVPFLFQRDDAQSPDLNPIEPLWDELKHWL